MKISIPDATFGLISLLMPLMNTAVVGAIAQMGERLHGMQEVGGSIPPGSTTSEFDVL